MSEANNNAELSGRSSLLCKALEATVYVKKADKKQAHIGLPCIESRLFEVKCNDVFVVR